MFVHVFCVFLNLFFNKISRRALCLIQLVVQAIRAKAQAMETRSRIKSVLYCLLVSLAVELNSRALISVLEYQYSQPLISLLHSTAALLMFYVYLLNKHKIILPLVIFNGVYGIIQLLAMHDGFYHALQPVIWGGSLNYEKIWRAVELTIIIKVLWDGGIFNIISNFIRDTRSRNRGDRIVHFIWR